MEVVIAAAHSENISQSRGGLSVAQCKESEYFVFIKILKEELSDMSSKNILGVKEIGKIDGVRVGDPPSVIKHEPLDASQGARIMAKEVGVVFLMFLSIRLI